MPASATTARTAAGGGIMLSKLRAAAAELGWTNAILYGINRVSKTRWGGFVQVDPVHLVVHAVRRDPVLPPRRGRGIETRRLSTDEALKCGVPISENLIESRRQGEAVCLAAFKDDRLIGYRWLQLGPYSDEEVHCTFVAVAGRRAAWGWNFFVAPQHRTSFVFARLWDETYAFLRDNDLQWIFSWISAFTPAVLTAEQRLGAHRLGGAVFISVGPVQLLLATIAPFVHVSLRRAAPPRLVLPIPGTEKAA